MNEILDLTFYNVEPYDQKEDLELDDLFERGIFQIFIQKKHNQNRRLNEIG